MTREQIIAEVVLYVVGVLHGFLAALFVVGYVRDDMIRRAKAD